MRKICIPLFLFATLLVACGTYTPSRTNYGYINENFRDSRTGNLPANPNPEKCYVRVVTLDEYEYYEDEYLTYSEAEADEYAHKFLRVELSPEISRWEVTTYEGCTSADPNDCQVLCYRTYPARYENIYVPLDSTLGNPQHRVVVRQVLVHKGGLTSYEEIDCDLMTYNLLPVRFADQSAALTQANQAIVQEQLLGLLKDRPNLQIEIISHTDSRGSAAANQLLSERRSQSVADYLIENGIVAGRLVSRGVGESRLINRCADGVDCTEAEHSVNDRVEFRVISRID